MSVIFKTVSIGMLALLLATTGFNHAPASSQHNAPPAPKPRVAVVPTLGFANPLITDALGDYHDLGDALVGSAFSGFIRAQNGVAPYSYSLSTNSTDVEDAGLELYANGILKNSAAQSTLLTPLGALQFNVLVEDASGSTPNSADELFQITFTNDTTFRFANDSLCNASRFREYADSLRVINADATLAFSISQITLNGSALPNLEAVGLSLAKDGNIFGIPLKSGTLAFTATATKTGSTAAARNGSGTSQAFSLTIAENTTLSNTLISNPVTLQLGVPGKDSITLKSVANLNDVAISSLLGKSMSLRIGNYVSPEAIFDAKGNASFSSAAATVAGTVKPGGLVTFTISKATIDVGKITGSTKTMGLELRVGDAVLGTEFLNFALTTGKGTLRTLAYKGTLEDDWGGGFEVLTALGTDDLKKTGDAWRASFLAFPPRAMELEPATLNTVDLTLGGYAFSSMTLKNTAGKLSGRIGTTGLFNADFTTTGKGTFNAPLLWSSDTKISTASLSGGDKSIYALNMSFKTGTTAQFGGVGGMWIYPNRSAWNNTKP